MGNRRVRPEHPGFIVIGLQIRPILDALDSAELARYLSVAGAVTVIAVRVAWHMSFNWVVRHEKALSKVELLLPAQHSAHRSCLTVPMNEGERALFRDNYGVDPPAPSVPTQPVDVLESLSARSDERELIASVLGKDRKAAARLVAAHIDAVYAYARHRLSPHADLVDDVVQDVFLAALKSLAAFEGQASLRTWLLAIARHKIEDIYRQRLRAALTLELDSTEDDPPSNEIPLDEQIDTARAGAKARRILQRMPERYALLLLWRYWEQRSAREVAAAIGTTEKSVERLLARARAKFKELWLKE